jgi:hypothetical protein
MYPIAAQQNRFISLVQRRNKIQDNLKEFSKPNINYWYFIIYLTIYKQQKYIK